VIICLEKDIQIKDIISVPNNLTAKREESNSKPETKNSEEVKGA
jgi:hypothetical protein